RNGDGRLVLVPRLDNGRYANVGTVAAVETAGELPSGLRAVVVRGLQRARIGAGVPGTGSALWVQVEPVDDPTPSERAVELARESLLRQPLSASRKELGEGDGDEADERYRTWLAETAAPEHVKTAVERELNRLERTSEQSPENGWIRTWLDTVVELPWGVRSD